MRAELFGELTMRVEMLNLLECPFCGGELRLENGAGPEHTVPEVITGILLCDCCAFPVVDGIPYLRTGGMAERAMKFIGAGEEKRALAVLLGLPDDASTELNALTSETITFRQALRLLAHTPESGYLLYRFSDPTFIASHSLLKAVTQEPRCTAGYILDLCGGAGHLTRTMTRAAAKGVVLADLEFWKLYLAKHFVAPDCEPVCCDANAPLPFKRSIFSLVTCSDAFHYIWTKRQLIAEMQRAAGADGTIVLAHLHNGLSWNPSQGMPLSPAAYGRLFHQLDVRMYDERRFLEAGLRGGPIDLSTRDSDADVNSAPALVIVASRLNHLFRVHELPADNEARPLALNPLYQRVDSSPSQWRRTFPSPEYEDEYKRCRDYLPASVELSAGQLEQWRRGLRDETGADLARQRVLLELPPRYV
jgi:SAM-dependent methyltransferase/uncharacterized protein YbaR (Trm112 family)